MLYVERMGQIAYPPRGSSRVAFLLAIIPACLNAQDATEVRAATPRTSTLGADYTLIAFQEDAAPWHLGSLSFSRRTTSGSLIARANLAHRFATTGAQVEVDVYPRISKSLYAYASVGYSTSSIFPAWRSGGELFASLPRAWEASAGYRQLRFGGAPVTLFTGAIGKYVGNYWLSLRPYVRNSSTGTSASASITTRRYFADGDHYIGTRIGYGSAASDQRLPDASSLSRKSSFSASIQGSGDVVQGLLGTWSLGYDREELAASRVRTGWSVATGLRMGL